MWPALFVWTSPGISYNAAAPAAPSLYPGLSDAASGDSFYHITGLAQLLMIGLLAFPIWLFGILIGILLPKGFSESRAASAVSEWSSLASDVGMADTLSSESSSTRAVHISSRPLSDDELEISSSDGEQGEEGEVDGQQQPPDHSGTAAAHASRGTGLLARLGKPSAPPVSTAGQQSVSWAQQLSQLLSSKQHVKDAPETPPQPAAAPVAATASRWHSPFSSASYMRTNHTALPLQQQQQGGLAAAGVVHAPSPNRRQYHKQDSGSAVDSHRWYVNETDLDKFTTSLAPVEDRLLSGNIGQPWSLIMDKDVPGVVRYLSYWRPTETGSTDYLSVTIIPDATAQEMHEYNLDDATRTTWDPMLKSTWLLGSRDLTADEQLVVWLRTFPMGFLSDRLYAGIARRTFSDPKQPNSLIGVSKVVHTPATAAWAAEHFPGIIQTDNCFSAWRCRTIPSPWANSSSSSSLGSTTPPACEIILLHHDELKVSEYLSRVAIKVGMWKFVQGMVDSAGTWLEERRARVDPFQPDGAAACRQQAAPLTGAAAAAAAEAAGIHHHHHHPTAAAASLIARGSGSDARDQSAAGTGLDAADAEDMLLSPRLLYAVPTAPDLLSFDVTSSASSANENDVSSMDARHDQASGAVSKVVMKVTARGHRRGHSMEWEPNLDSSSASMNTRPVVAAGGGGGSRAGSSKHMYGHDLSPLGDMVHVSLPPISTARPGQEVPLMPPCTAAAAAVSGSGDNSHQGRGMLGVNPIQAVCSLPGSVSSALTGFVGGLAAEASKRVVGICKGPGPKAAAAPVADRSAAAAAGVPTVRRSAAEPQQHAVKWGDSVNGPQDGCNLGQPGVLPVSLSTADMAAAAAGLTDKVRGRSGSVGSGGRSRSTSSTVGEQHEFAVDVRKRLLRGMVVVAAAVISGLLLGAAPGSGTIAYDLNLHDAEKEKEEE